MSVIARTAGIGRTPEELQWDLNYLMQLWRAVEDAAQAAVAAPFLIYQESSLVIRAIRDYFHPDIGEILIDTEAIHEQAQQFMGHVMPGNVPQREALQATTCRSSRASRSSTRSRPRIRAQVPLPSGGAIVIDHTEALVADRRQLGARDKRRRHRGDGATTPTSKPPTKSRASCACATWAA